ncbi:MAG TPA: helix-turn-helix transcriptional regulator [Terriglobia bacterium]|nr:helix-turn-helix transcriptional regulator [Terriglobia bacterium]
MELLHLREAAKELGVSYPTLKQWIYRGRIRSVKTAGGHHRIPRAEIDGLLFRQNKAAAVGAPPASKRAGSAERRVSVRAAESGLEHFISGRNQLVGRITQVKTIGLLSKVSLDIGGQTVTAVITRDAVRDLGLKVGDTAAALIKATEVMVIRPVGEKLPR